MSKALSRNEVKSLWKSIDRKLKLVTADTEIAGEPNKALTAMDFTALTLPDDMHTVLGALSAAKMSQLQDAWEKDKLDKIKRYEKLKSAQEHPEIDGVLNIYADEATTEDQEGVIIHVQHPDPKVRSVVEDMFDRIGLEEKAWQIIRNYCGFGDEYYEVVIARSAKSILKIDHLPREAIDRIEENNILKGFRLNKKALEASNMYTFQTNFQTPEEREENLIFPFRILHFRIPSDKYGVYGQSVIDAIITTIEKLKMMEKAMVVARVTRAPERRVYQVDVGNLAGEKAIRYARDVVENFKSKKKLSFYSDINKQTDLQQDIFGTVEDLVIPKRAGSEGNAITTLEQANNLGDIADIEFLRDKIFPSIGIPRQYFFDDSFANANTNLSSKSVVFAKRIRRIQRFFLNQVYKLAIIELKLKGYSNQDIANLTLFMNNPSNIDDRERIALETERWGLITAIKSLNAEHTFYPDYLIYQDFLKLGKDEIVLLMKLCAMQDNGMNPFEVFPMEERPEGAEDIQVSTGVGGMGGVPIPGPKGVGNNEELGPSVGGGMPNTEAGIPEAEEEKETPEAAIPPEVESELGAPKPENAPPKKPKKSENADVREKTGVKPYTEKEMRAIQRKNELLKKLSEFQKARKSDKEKSNEKQYAREMCRARTSALIETFIRGHLNGIDIAYKNVSIFDGSEFDNEVKTYSD